MTDVDDTIRRMAGREPARPGGAMTTNVDDAIRRMAGRAPDLPEDYDASATENQRRAAELTGLPARFAHRLTGDGPAMVDDARSMVTALGEHGVEPEAPISFDGGVRQRPPSKEPMGDRVLNDALRSLRGHRGTLTVGEDMFVFTRRSNG